MKVTKDSSAAVPVYRNYGPVLLASAFALTIIGLRPTSATTAFSCAIALIVFGVLETIRAKRRAIALEGDLDKLQSAVTSLAGGRPDVGVPAPTTSEAQMLHRALVGLSHIYQEKIVRFQQQAHHDPLTELPNRSQFKRLVELRLIRRLEGGLSGAMLFVDIDGFKNVNDTLGHNVGDHILKLIATRIVTVVDATVQATRSSPAIGTAMDASEPIVARLGGDEFTVFLPGDVSEKDANKLAARILRVLAEPFELGAQSISLSCSIGIALVPLHATQYDELLRSADTAMYHAKRQGKNRAETYSPDLDQEMLDLARMSQELKEALSRNQFFLLFQPQVDCHTREIISAEVLIRWNHPQRGVVGPDEFIPLAEKLDLMGDIGDWVLVESIKAAARFAALALPIRIAVNVSPLQLQRIEFIAMVKASLQRWQVPGKMIELEVTESVAMHEDSLTIERLSNLRKLGVTMAIDDFGTGYSNLARLTRLPIDALKIDRSLITNIMDQIESQLLIQMIIGMADGLGLQVIAEGVETEDQLQILTSMGCDMAQGFLLSRAVTESALTEQLEAQIPPILVNRKLGNAG